MKWVYLIIVLIVGGALYYLTTRNPEARADTPRGAANLYISAALSGNQDQVRSMCAPSVVDNAQRIAGQIGGANPKPDPRSFKWQATAAHDPSVTALTALFQGRVLTIELKQENGDYKIVAIDLAS